ncbi:MAG: protoporphyrinogen oxidase [Actinomycetia bacterium]|nr:protoporphyrinogen oxidase [Actinomycetes bacterium]
MTARIAIIGAGAAGLGAAWFLRQQQDAGADLEFRVYDQDTRTGGKVAGETVPDPVTGKPWLIDGGPDCFSAYKQAPTRIARELGFEDDLLPSDMRRRGTWIVRDGRPHRLPEGFRLFIPTQMRPLLETELLSEEGKRRMLEELWAPQKVLAPGEPNEESLEGFIVRRFGRETLDYFAEPFIGGVHAGDPKTMSLGASFPSYLEMEQSSGSLIRGTILAEARRSATRADHDPDEKPQSVFSTFKGGLQQLTDALTAAIGVERFCLNTRIRDLRQDPHALQEEAVGGARSRTRATPPAASLSAAFSFTAEHLEPQPVDAHAAHPGDVDPHPPRVVSVEQVEVDAVIIATESFAGAALTRALDPRLSELYASIPCSSSATASFGFDEATLGLSLDGFGILVPEVEGRDLLALTFSSSKWQGHAPQGRVLLRGFAGTPLNQTVMERSDAELTALMLAEIRDILGLDPSIEPLFSRFYRWTGGMAQYTLGHEQRVAEIDRRVAARPGLAVAGGCFRGIGVPNCLDGGRQAAEKLLADLQIGVR